jgi:hypothetical protein
MLVQNHESHENITTKDGRRKRSLRTSQPAKPTEYLPTKHNIVETKKAHFIACSPLATDSFPSLSAAVQEVWTMKLNRKSLVELWSGCAIASIVVRVTLCIKTLLTLPKGGKKRHPESTPSKQTDWVFSNKKKTNHKSPLAYL